MSQNQKPDSDRAQTWEVSGQYHILFKKMVNVLMEK
jgi:hypothetical protein